MTCVECENKKKNSYYDNNSERTFTLTCDSYNTDASFDLSTFLKNYFVIVTSGIPTVGGPISSIISIFWPNNTEHYEDLFQAFLCRAKEYVKKEVMDAQAANMENIILETKLKMENIDGFVA
ncbi:hypothetical protein [Enterovibrio nigricans]|uniref:Uncharacterized protein n=1 Tax=Enterovibrio nigricans DSM 22720 TaxID=1121868 RepID=A0A1T4WG92_9GAMM|nr:hypothetical protein [Enterovibrio nigricans]PKF48667.1 hypothetical protein AT251_24415 [Enterovibrio nigricans]SKA76356.1 hypothetical protein SAMN02745132_04922 [Enterovibrio nigricans DSM 22720]